MIAFTQNSQNYIYQQPKPIYPVHPHTHLIALSLLAYLFIVSENKGAGIVGCYKGLYHKVSVDEQKDLNRSVEIKRNLIVLNFIGYLNIQFTYHSYKRTYWKQKDNENT